MDRAGDRVSCPFIDQGSMTVKDDMLADLPLFLNPDEFGDDATFKGVAIHVDFHQVFEGASPLDGIIESRKEWAVAKSSDVAGAVHGDTLTIGVTAYKIMGIEPGDSGMTVLRLSL